ncbi:unnamed protein product, partial [Ectocarpus sp. 8 AP-2014]
APVNFKDLLGQTPLHHATTGGAPVIEALARNDADIEATDNRDRTSLRKLIILAAQGVPIDREIDALINLGADIDNQDGLGRTMLMSLAFGKPSSESVLAVEKLLQFGADVNKTDFRGVTALTHYARA